MYLMHHLSHPRIPQALMISTPVQIYWNVFGFTAFWAKISTSEFPFIKI